MDAFILVFTLGIMLAIGVPVAYAVGISAIVGAWSVAGEHCRINLFWRDLRIVGGGYRIDRFSDDP